MRTISFLLLLFWPLVAGCQDQVAPSSTAVASVPPSDGLPPRAASGDPQPKLPTVKLWIGTNEITAEIASKIHEIQTGMMWRTNMAEMEGMLFVFREPQSVSFYMRNTLLPLSCAYVDAQGTVLELHDMKPRDETPIPSASDEVQYVLEMNQGWFGRHNVKPGMLMTTQYGTLPQTFSRRR